MKKRAITCEATLLEPEDNPDGSRSVPAALLFASATLTDDGREYHVGSDGGMLWIYLDDDKAVRVDALQLFAAARALLADPPTGQGESDR